MSKIKTHLYECKYRGFITRGKPLVTTKNKKARIDFGSKSPPSSGIKSLDRWNQDFTRTMGREKHRGEKRLMIRIIPHHLSNCDQWAWAASGGTIYKTYNLILKVCTLSTNAWSTTALFGLKSSFGMSGHNHNYFNDGLISSLNKFVRKKN